MSIQKSPEVRAYVPEYVLSSTNNICSFYDPVKGSLYNHNHIAMTITIVICTYRHVDIVNVPRYNVKMGYVHIPGGLVCVAYVPEHV